MCEYFIPQQAYYAYIPILVITFLSGLLIYFSDRKKSVNRNLFLFVLLLCFWEFNELLQWVLRDPWWNLLSVRLSVLVILGLPPFLFFTYYFSGLAINKIEKILLSLPLIPILLLIFTDYNAYMNDVNTCTAGSGPLYFYVYTLAIVYLGLSVKNLIYVFKKKGNNLIEKNQAKIISVALSIDTVWIITFSIIWSLVEKISYEQADFLSLFSNVGNLILVVMITYAIVRYQFLHIKLLAAQALVWAINILIGSQFFFIRNPVNQILTGITLVLTIVFGWWLVRSVKKEVQISEELRDMNEKLGESYDKVQKLDRAKSEFVSIASHQLRTPCTAVKGFLSLVLDGSYGKISQKVRSTLEKVYVANERLINLVEDLLNVSRIESGRLTFRFMENDIVKMSQEIVDNLIFAAKNKNLYLNFEPPKIPVAPFVFDRDKVREVVSNLVDNAIKYTKEGGVTVLVAMRDNRVRVMVTDTGMGITPGEEKYIFEKFQRSEEVAKVHTEGLGLGLFVALKIVEAHQGRIWAESKGLGLGSTFFLELKTDFVPPEQAQTKEGMKFEIN